MNQHPHYKVESWSDHGVRFVPFVGGEYEEGLIDGLRVLLLGESHYGKHEKATRDLTISEFEDLAHDMPKIWHGFWGKLQRIAARDPKPSQEKAGVAWRHIAFANFVQQLAGERPRQRPDRAAWKTGNDALPVMLDRLQPNAVLILGKGTWDHVKVGDYDGSSIQARESRKSEREIWRLPHAGGHALSTWVYHPSANRDTIQTSIDVFSELLERARDTSR